MVLQFTWNHMYQSIHIIIFVLKDGFQVLIDINSVGDSDTFGIIQVTLSNHLSFYDCLVEYIGNIDDHFKNSFHKSYIGQPKNMLNNVPFL